MISFFVCRAAKLRRAKPWRDLRFIDAEIARIARNSTDPLIRACKLRFEKRSCAVTCWEAGCGCFAFAPNLKQLKWMACGNMADFELNNLNKIPKKLPEPEELRDFSTDKRILLLGAMAFVIGIAGAGAAWALLALINLATNLAYFGRISAAPASIAANTLGLASVLVPVVGCLIIGLMARYGSDKIRGHGIPEAIEAILIGRSRIRPKVAILKPLSSAISIGTGGSQAYSSRSRRP